MPSPKKIRDVAALKKEIDKAQVMILADYRGLTVAELSDLRTRLRGKASSFRVIKNRLFKLALSDHQAETIDSLLKGPTGVALAFEDPVALAKLVGEYAKENKKFELKGGLFGEEELDINGIQQLAKMPGLQELRAQLACSVKQPLTEVATMMTASARELATASQQMLSKMANAFQNRLQQLG